MPCNHEIQRRGRSNFLVFCFFKPTRLPRMCFIKLYDSKRKRRETLLATASPSFLYIKKTNIRIGKTSQLLPIYQIRKRITVRRSVYIHCMFRPGINIWEFRSSAEFLLSFEGFPLLLVQASFPFWAPLLLKLLLPWSISFIFESLLWEFVYIPSLSSVRARFDKAPQGARLRAKQG